MSRGRMVLAMLAVLVVGALVGALAASGSESDLEKQVQALTERVANLEQAIEALKNQNPEQQAATAFREIDTLIKNGNIEQAKTQFDSFLAKYGGTRVGQQAQGMRDEFAVLGKDSPADWHISKWYQGEGDFKLDGKGTTMLVFWETWCPHCQREVPKFQELYTNYKSKGLKLVGVTKVTKDATDDKVMAFIQEKKLTYPIAKEDGQLSLMFNVAGIPAAAVVKDGKVVWRGHPARLTSEMIENWL